MFDLDIDLSDCRRACVRAGAEASAGLRLVVNRGAEEAIAESKASHPYKDVSGELTRSAYARPGTAGPLKATAEMGWKAKHASYVDQGTKAHDIWPKAGHGTMGPLRQGQSRREKSKLRLAYTSEVRMALRWTKDGVVRFARMVRHPGSRATGFAGKAAQKVERVALREIEKLVLRLEHIFNN